MSWAAWKRKSSRFDPDMNAALRNPGSSGPAAQPNELDRKRISRALVSRKRYRYVSPTVRQVENGYVIESPCCSRRVDPEGGVVDVALLQYVAGDERPWHLYRKVHALGHWEPHGSYGKLQEALEQINSDPHRLFWQ